MAKLTGLSDFFCTHGRGPYSTFVFRHKVCVGVLIPWERKGLCVTAGQRSPQCCIERGQPLGLQYCSVLILSSRPGDIYRASPKPLYRCIKAWEREAGHLHRERDFLRDFPDTFRCIQFYHWEILWKRRMWLSPVSYYYWSSVFEETIFIYYKNWIQELYFVNCILTFLKWSTVAACTFGMG